jgi:hypothetical protein
MACRAERKKWSINPFPALPVVRVVPHGKISKAISMIDKRIFSGTLNLG